MKKKILALVFAAMLTGACCVSCGNSDDRSSSRRSSHSKHEDEDEYESAKSRIMSACADAKQMMTIANQALAEMDEEGIQCTLYGWVDVADWDAGGEVTNLFDRMASFGDAVKKTEFSVYIRNGAAVSACAKNGRYFGVYPGKLTEKNYKDILGEKPDFDDAKAAAVEFYNENHDAMDWIS